MDRHGTQEKAPFSSIPRLSSRAVRSWGLGGDAGDEDTLRMCMWGMLAWAIGQRTSLKEGPVLTCRPATGRTLAHAHPAVVPSKLVGVEQGPAIL